MTDGIASFPAYTSTESDERSDAWISPRVARECASPHVVLTSAEAWARRYFGRFSVLVVVGVAILTLLDGVSAARHYHVAVAVCGVLIVALVAAWFAVAQRRNR